jgi:hypothetical protein
LVLRKIQELIAIGKVKVISMEISSEVATYLLSQKMETLSELKSKFQLDFNFTSKPGLSYENYKFDVEKTKEEEPEIDSKVSDTKTLDGKTSDIKIDKESVKSERAQPAAKTDDVEKTDAEKSPTQTKRRYSKRKPNQRGGQTRGRGRRPYNSRKKPDAETPNTAGEEQLATAEPVKTDGEQFNRLPSEVEPPIIPLPLPFVRPETDSARDGNVKE